MKNLQEILEQLEKEPIFLHDFSDEESVYREFCVDKGDTQILWATYTYENYSGDATVLFKENGKYYEVHGSHCSCYGLEGQWDAEEVNLLELENRITKGNSDLSIYFSRY